MELTFDNVTKFYGDKPALRDVSLRLTEGIYGLLGPNGAGKSTLMNILTGNLNASSGRILYCNKDIRELGDTFSDILGYMPQQQALYPDFSCRQFLFYIASLRGMSKRMTMDAVDSILESVALSDVQYRPIRTLSGGMKQRLLLAQAIFGDPKILILDEPTAGLDPQQRIRVRNLISQISLNKIVIISTHIVPDIDFIADKIIMLSDGKIIREDSPERLIKDLNGKVWEITTDDDHLGEVLLLGKVCCIVRSGNKVVVRLLMDDAPPFPSEPVLATLEDCYLFYFT